LNAHIASEADEPLHTDPQAEAVPEAPEASIQFAAPDEAEIAAIAEPPHIEPAAATLPIEPEVVFEDLGLSEPILRAIAEKGYRHPTPIQAQAIPAVLSGRDVMGVAQTGTGKTASFTLPMLDILDGSRARARMPRSLILEPTRELALQVAENFVEYGKYLKLTHALLIGGESLNDQKEALMKGVDVLIATPGRLIDLFERGGMMLTDAKLLVIDEADRMLDMGFIPDVERIVAMLPKTRQTLFFSATMAPEIRRLSDAFLQNPRLITVSKSASVATTIVAGYVLVAETDKREALRRLIRSEDVQNALIFCNRKRDVDILYKSLTRHGFSVGALHGDMSQPARFATLEKFKQNELRLLVCSDVAARGIDIGGLSHVFNFDVPQHAEDYVHRIGRTGRAGLKGHAFTLCSPEDRLAIEAIEKLTAGPIARIVVPGLDVVEWAEGDSRKRRGRGGKPQTGKPDAEKPRARKAEPTADEPAQPRRSRGGKPEGRAKQPDRAPRPEAEAAPEPQIASRPSRPAPRAEPSRQEPRFERPQNRDQSRDYRRRDEDLGPSVQGFGDDIPAFMTLPRRADRPHAASTEDQDA
jgi:superfamily II DNA/RNA helicase